jgi:hypothetical protein
MLVDAAKRQTFGEKKKKKKKKKKENKSKKVTDFV